MMPKWMRDLIVAAGGAAFLIVIGVPVVDSLGGDGGGTLFMGL